MEIQGVSSFSANLLTGRTQAPSRKEKTETSEGTSESAENQTTTAKAAGGRPVAPPPPPVGSGPKSVAAPESSGNSSSSSSSTAKTYDKRDINQDGTVSDQESVRYALTHAADQNQAATTTTNNQIQAGLNAYQQVQSANINNSVSSRVLSI
jgi:hypothetical protein